jgi:hypothetical protein
MPHVGSEPTRFLRDAAMRTLSHLQHVLKKIRSIYLFAHSIEDSDLFFPSEMSPFEMTTAQPLDFFRCLALVLRSLGYAFQSGHQVTERKYLAKCVLLSGTCSFENVLIGFAV